MLSQSLLVSLSRIVSLTRYRWKARYLTYKQVLGLFLVGHRELGTLKWLLTILYQVKGTKHIAQYSHI